MSFKSDMQSVLENELSGMFPNASKRLAIWAETDKYKWKEDESVWRQKRELDAPQFEVHFDGEFVCFMDASKGVGYNKIEFLQNLRELYKSGKIFVHTELYEVKKAEDEAKRKANSEVIVPEATTPEEKMIVSVIEKSAKKRNKKVIQK